MVKPKKKISKAKKSSNTKKKSTQSQEIRNVKQQLKKHEAINQQLTASEQQLKAANQQLIATEQQLRASEENLKKANEELERILNMSYDLICIAGMDGYFKYVNSAWERTLGYSTEELLEKPFLDFIHPDDHAKNDDEVEHLSGGDNTIGFENIIDMQAIISETMRNIFDGVSHHEVAEALILAASAFIEHDPAYGFVASRLLFKKLFKQVTKKSVFDPEFDEIYRKSFVQAMQKGAAY